MRSSEQTSASSTEVANSLAKRILPLLCTVALATIGCGTSAGRARVRPGRTATIGDNRGAAVRRSGRRIGECQCDASQAYRTWVDVPGAAGPKSDRLQPPNQGFPTLGTPPPADRPASFTFMVFDGNAIFVGTEILLRTDIYDGQTCESTGEPYAFRAPIGYYECVHTTGR